MKFKDIFIYPFLLTIIACGDDGVPPLTPDEPTGPSVEKTVIINAEETFQVITSFGASDCWIPAFIGKKWTSTRDRISELLFSSEMKDGQPQGIGLTEWRVNLGGGTMEQGEASGLKDKTRRAESYLTDNLTLDWSRCEGQRYFMSRAKQLGCNRFTLFSNTPPVQYTSNGKGFSSSGDKSNLKSDCYDDFAKYMTDVAQHYINQGYPITHISPVNEPQYNWDNGQEGSGWANSEVAKIARELDKSLTSAGLPTDILLAEAGDWESLYKTTSDPNRSNVLEAFFTPGSSSYVGDLKHMKKIISGHSYWTDSSWDKMRNIRAQLALAAKRYEVEVWQTEWSMLSEYVQSEFVGFEAASEMDIALYMSKVIHNDLTVAEVTSWSYWTSMGVPLWGHKNRFLLISLIPAGGVNDDIENEGSHRATATLWVLGNYSRFIRPGYRRIHVGISESRSFFGSAWISPERDKIVVVYSNLSDKGVRLNETHKGWSDEVKSIATYTTAENKSLKERHIAAGKVIVLDAKSVTTVVYNLK